MPPARRRASDRESATTCTAPPGTTRRSSTTTPNYLASQQVANRPEYQRHFYHSVRGQAYLETGQTGAAVSDFEQSPRLTVSALRSKSRTGIPDFGNERISKPSNTRWAWPTS